MKKFSEFVSESASSEEVLNEGQSKACENFVKKFVNNTDVNYQNFEEVVIPLAQHIDDYSDSSHDMGDLTYSKNTLKAFNTLVQSMANDYPEQD